MKRLLPSIIAAALLAVAVAPASAQEAPVAARDMRRGVVLTAEDIVGGEGSEEIIGWVTRRVISEGDALEEPAIAAPDVIRSGDDVQLVWSDGSLEIRMNGRAMGSAAKGEKVLVRVDTQRRYQGVAVAPGEVRLPNDETR